MSITEQRLKDYQLQMSIYAEQHKMLLASDVLDMIEQLQDDLKDDVDKVVEQLEKESYQEWCDSPKVVELKDAIEIVKGGGVNGNNRKDYLR